MKTTEEILLEIDKYIEEVHSKYTASNNKEEELILNAQLQSYYKIKMFINNNNQ